MTESATTAQPRLVRVGDYLIERLQELGVGHVFGVPGDFVLGFMRQIERSESTLVNTCDEQGAGLADADLPRRDPSGAPRPAPIAPVENGRADAPIMVDRLFGRLAAFLADDLVVIADPGDALFAVADLPIGRSPGFLAPAYYASLGFAVPAAIGAQLAAPGCRPLVLVGDGAFQMTGVELSTAVRYGLNPIVVVLNNGGYGTERLILDGAFNDVLPWDFARLPDLLGAGRGFRVETEGDLDRALAAAKAETDTFLLDVRLDPKDVSPALRRLAGRLSTAATGAGHELVQNQEAFSGMTRWSVWSAPSAS